MRFLVSLTLMAGTATAQDLEGLYRPDYPWAASWSCEAEALGADGGAVGILDGQLHGVENTCDLTNPKTVEGGTAFTAVCSGEGETYSSAYVIRPTSTGITLERDGEVVQWRRCDIPASAIAEPSNGEWTMGFAMGVTEAWTRDGEGNEIIFTCNGGREGAIYINLFGKPVPAGEIVFSVDGQEVRMQSKPDGEAVETGCSVCQDSFIKVWKAVAAGSRLTVTAGRRSAAFSLEGSRDALGPDVCLPEPW